LWCFIVRIIDFITEFRKILEFLLKKIEIPYIQNIFRIPSFTICFLNFLVFLTSLFSILPVYGFQKNYKIFVWFYCMDPRFYQKILQNYVFLLKKKLRYLKSKISTKFRRLVFLFYFFSIFGILFSIVVFYWKG